MSKRIRELWRAVFGFVDDAIYDIKYKIDNWNECPVCSGYGELVEDRVEWWDITSPCFFCDGSGKVGLLKLIDFWLHRKEYKE